MDNLAYLSTLDERSFTAERCRIIASEILKAPPESRKPLVLLQMELDKLRDTLTPEQFMAECMRRSTESLENLADQFGLIKSAIVPPPIKSPAER